MSVVTIDPFTAALWEYKGSKDEDYPWGYTQIERMVERANRGALVLDERDPGWNFRVVPEKLDMTNGALCIVGQTYGSYGEYVGPVFGLPQGVEDDQQAVEHGFLTKDDEDMPWALMDLVWVYLLTTRAESGEPDTIALPPRESQRKQLSRLRKAGYLPKS